MLVFLWESEKCLHYRFRWVGTLLIWNCHSLHPTSIIDRRCSVGGPYELEHFTRPVDGRLCIEHILEEGKVIRHAHPFKCLGAGPPNSNQKKHGKSLQDTSTCSHRFFKILFVYASSNTVLRVILIKWQKPKFIQHHCMLAALVCM